MEGAGPRGKGGYTLIPAFSPGVLTGCAADWETISPCPARLACLGEGHLPTGLHQVLGLLQRVATQHGALARNDFVTIGRQGERRFLADRVFGVDDCERL